MMQQHYTYIRSDYNHNHNDDDYDDDAFARILNHL